MSLKILIAEDNEINQRLLINLLEFLKHSIVLAKNGQEVLEKSLHEEFDLILMDIQMPKVDGYEATRMIREREKETNVHIPIIAMTAFAHDSDKEKCLEAGMDGYMSKPIDLDKLKYTLSQYSLLKEEIGKPIIANNKKEPPSNNVFDYEISLDRAGGKKELLEQLLKMFLERLPKYLQDIKDAINIRNSNNIGRTAHTFKGILKNFNAIKTADIALKIERMGKSNKTMKVNEEFKRLLQEVDVLKEEIQKTLKKLEVK